MSPEQILGDRLDFRSDLFSLGIVLYQMITGRKPFVEDEARTVMQKIRLDRYTQPRKLNPAVPRQLERILARCMEKMPANRYPTTQALIDDLMEFIAPRVPMNYNARVVMYLRDCGELSEQEAEKILDAGAPRTFRRNTGDRKVVRHMAVVQAALFAAILASGGAIQAAAGRLGGDSDEYAAEAGTPVIPPRAGYLKVVVDPWAHVKIDGQKVFTTPSAQPIALPAGKHYLELENPYFHDVNKELRVEAGKAETIRIEMKPLRKPGDRAAVAPQATKKAEGSK